MTRKRLDRIRRKYNASRRVHATPYRRHWDLLVNMCMRGLYGCTWHGTDTGYSDLRLAVRASCGHC